MSFAGSQQYRAIGTHGGSLAAASPYQVVRVMLEATLLSRLAEAAGHLERGEVAAKGEKIGKALAIIEALMLGLDKRSGGVWPTTWSACNDLRVAHPAEGEPRESCADLVREVSSLLREVKLGWDDIAPVKA